MHTIYLWNMHTSISPGHSHADRVRPSSIFTVSNTLHEKGNATSLGLLTLSK